MQLKWSLGRFGDATIVVLILITAWRFLGVIGQWPLDGSAASPLTPAVKAGDILRLPGVKWSARRTVVLFLNSTCPACNENVPFYRQVAASVTSELQVIALSAQAEGVIGEWLSQSQVDVRSMHKVADPIYHGLTLTPMVLIVNTEGRVTDLMIRRLNESDQAQMLEQIRNPSATALDNSQQIREITTSEMDRMKSDRPIQILDVRPRERFQSGHRNEARNIPAPELSSRAPIEVESRVSVIIDCLQPGAATSCRAAAWTLIEAGFDNVFILIR